MGIKVVPDKGLNGNSNIHSPLPTNNTIRYIELEITNEDGVEARKVAVAQYPLEYITNIQGWYSYRKDFKRNDSRPTTYEYKGDGIVGVSLETTGWWGEWTGEYHYETSSQRGFWYSKIAVPTSNGKSNINSYYYGSRNTPASSLAERDGNARMYHVRISASSKDYTLGRPRLIEDEHNPGLMVTDKGADNKKLVSPSFMIASRLGFVNTGNGGVSLEDDDESLRIVREHCANYVEVYKDVNDRKVVLDDWRLPTEAELKIIMKFSRWAG